MDGKQQRQCSDSLLATRELVHVPVALGGRHGKVLDAPQEWLLAVLQAQVRLAPHRMH